MPALTFIPPRLPLTISRPRFTAFLRAFASPIPPALTVALAASPLDLARTLWGFPASPALADAFDLLDLLSTDAGLTAITHASRAASLRLPLRLPPADLAAVLLTRRATDPAYEGVLERALHAFARIVPHSAPLELVAGAPRALAASPDLFTRAVRDLLTPKRFVALFHGTDDHGSLHIAIVRRARARAASVAATRRVRRDDIVDTLRIDVPDGRLILRCDDPTLESAYATAAGAALFSDPTFFTSADAPAYTLKPIVLLGSAALAAARPAGISRVRVVDITWDDGEGTTHSAHGSDALAAFEKHGGAAGGYVTSAMFRLDVPGVSRPIDVAIRLPDRAEYRTARHERLARAALASLGVFAPGSVADDSFTLAPWIHAEWRWRKVLGDALFEKMRDAKALVRAKTRMVSGPAMGKYGFSYVSFDLRSDPKKKYAVAMDPALPSRDLDADELRMWRLDPAVVARALALDLQTDPAPPNAVIAASALDLGNVREAEIPLRVFAVLRAPGPSAHALVDAMVRAAGAAHLMVLLPEGKTLGGGTGAIEIGLTLAQLFGQERVAAKVFGEVAAKKGIPSIVPPCRFAAPDTRFVAEEATGRMWFDRHELVLRESAARILLGTARGGGKPVPTSALARFVAPNRSDDGVIRQTVPRLGEWIRESFVAKGLLAPEDAGELVEFVANKGWKMNVKCEVR
jgi:hypothetical protein